MRHKSSRGAGFRRLAAVGAGVASFIAAAAVPGGALAQQASVPAWDASGFRVGGYIPYWATQTQINNFATNGMYTHVSDVIHFGGLRPNASGDLAWAASSHQTQFNTLRSQMQTHGFNLHLSMFEVTGGGASAI